MAPYRRSTPSLNHRTNPRKTPWWILPRLRHAHTLRPEMPPFKRERETSHTSASLAPTTCYMVFTRIGCTEIKETTWMEESRKTVSGKRGGKKSFVFQPNAMTQLPGNLERDLWESYIYNLTGFVLVSGTLIG